MSNKPKYSGTALSERDRALTASGISKGNQSLLYHAFQNMSEMVIITGLDRTICYVNGAVRKILGYTPEELIGKKSYEFFEGIPGNTGELSERIRREACSGIWEGEIFNLRKDGRLITVKLNLSAIKDDDGELVGYMGVTRDISEQKKAEEKIKRLNRILRAVRDINQIIVKEKDLGRLLQKTCDTLISTRGYFSVWIILIDAEGNVYRAVETGVGPKFNDLVARFRSGNPPVCARRALYDAGIGLIERIPEECLNCPLRHSYPGRAVLTASLSHEKKVYGLLSVSLTRTAVFDREERELLLEIVGDIAYALHDITLEEELLTFRKMESLGALAGGIAHDFNNMLTTISGNLTLLKMAPRSSYPPNKIIKAMEKACRRAEELTRRLMTFARGGLSHKQPINLESIIRESVELALTGSEVQSSYRLAPDLRPVEADPGQIGQVINNLAINSLQATDGSGVIELRAENIRLTGSGELTLPPGEYVKVEVEDEGEGIPSGHLEKIFEPYFTTKHNGTGLGLSAAYSIIRKHGGTIRARSNSGKTVFTIYLPALAPGRQNSIRRSRESLSGSSR